MALSKPTKLKNQIELTAYCRIDRILYNKEYTEIITNLYNLVGDDKFLIDGESQTYTFYPDLSVKENIVKLAYLYLKTTDELKDATDC